MNPPRLYFPAMPWTSLASSALSLVVLIRRRQSRTPARSRLRGTDELLPAVMPPAGVERALAPQSMLVFGVFARKSFRDSIFGSLSSSSSIAVSISMPPPPAAAPGLFSCLTSVLISERRPAKSMPLAASPPAEAEGAGAALSPVFRFRLKFASWNFISSDLRAFRSFCSFSVAFSRDSVTPRSMPCVSSCFFLRTAASRRESMSIDTEVTFWDLLLSSSRTWSSSYLLSDNSDLPSAHFLLRLMSCSFRASDFLLHSSSWWRVIWSACLTWASSALTTLMSSPSIGSAFAAEEVRSAVWLRTWPSWNSSGFNPYRASTCSQFMCSSKIPWYLAGRVICSFEFINSMLFRLRAFVVSLGVRNSIKAYLPNISHRVIGLPSMMLRPTCPMALPKKSLSI
mmetsp:Transcript_3871/g.8430  ORF Transcript_3871/g.8430 Transcript_3871/m.8430 type:complete len:398 (-) Transcript_3871:1144-2337(-)